MRILVLGCNGMAGHTISLYFLEQGYDIVGFDRRKSALVPCIMGNALDSFFVRDMIQDGKFDYIINCIGILNQSAEDHKADAIYLNSYFPHFLSVCVKNTKTAVIHMSTDCVFSGDRGQYTEEDFPDGKTFYDRTKALGELNDGRNITLRNSVVGPDINPQGIGLLNWFMQQKGQVCGFTKAMWTGQTTLQLAKTMEAAMKSGARGLYNAVPNTSISKYELLRLFNHYLRHDALTVEAADRNAADKSLRRTKFEFDYRIPDYPAMIKELAEWMDRHKNLYPHYYDRAGGKMDGI